MRRSPSSWCSITIHYEGASVVSDRRSRPAIAANARWLSSEAAAHYLGLRETAFRRKVKAGSLPAPSYLLGSRTPRWDREALDARLALRGR